MPPPVSKVVSTSTPDLVPGVADHVDSVRKSWTQQTGWEIASEEQFFNLYKTPSPKMTSSSPKAKADQDKTFSPKKTGIQSPAQVSTNYTSAKIPTSVSVKPRTSSPQVKTDVNRNQFQANCQSPAQAGPSNYSHKVGNNSQPFDTRPVISMPGALHSIAGLPLPLVSSRQALLSTAQCPVMDTTELTRALMNKVEDTDMLLRRFYLKMEIVRQVGQRGLVHSRQAPVSWIVLGETQEKRWIGGVAARTREATRRLIGLLGEGGVSNKGEVDVLQVEVKKEEGKGQKCEVDYIDHDTSFNEEDRFSKTKWKRNEQENDGSSDENWYGNPKTPAKKCLDNEGSFQSPNLDFEESYLSRVTRSALSNLAALGSVTISTVVGTASMEEHVDARHATSRRVARELVETDQVEEIGTCPLCSQQMGMKILLSHASGCQG